MAAFTKGRIRIAFNLASKDGAIDVLTSAAPVIWRGNDLQFEMAAFFNESIIDISSVTTLTLQIKPYPTITGTALFSATQTTSFGTTVTAEQWVAGTHQQFIIPMTAAQSAIDLLGGLSRTCWLVARASCSGSSTVYTLGTALITVTEDGA